MEEYHSFAVSLDEFCKREQHSDNFKESLRKSLSEEGALFTIDGKDQIILKDYMDYTLLALEGNYQFAHGLISDNEGVPTPAESIKKIFMYDLACRGALREWILPLRDVLDGAIPSVSPFDEDMVSSDRSELVAGIKKIIEYFLDAQNMMLALNPTSSVKDIPEDTNASGPTNSI